MSCLAAHYWSRNGSYVVIRHMTFPGPSPPFFAPEFSWFCFVEKTVLKKDWGGRMSRLRQFGFVTIMAAQRHSLIFWPGRSIEGQLQAAASCKSSNTLLWLLTALIYSKYICLDCQQISSTSDPQPKWHLPLHRTASSMSPPLEIFCYLMTGTKPLCQWFSFKWFWTLIQAGSVLRTAQSLLVSNFLLNDSDIWLISSRADLSLDTSGYAQSYYGRRKAFLSVIVF